MTATAGTLALLLALAAAAPANTDECELADHRCKATLFERRAANAENPEHRAVYLFNAHRLYMRLFDESGQARDLCAARRAIDASLAVAGQSPSLRSKSETMRAEVLARTKHQDARCSSGSTRRRRKPAAAPGLPPDPTTHPPAVASADPRAAPPDSSPTATTTRPLPLLIDADPPQQPTGPNSTPSATRPLPLLIDAEPPQKPTELALLPVAPRHVDTPPATEPRAPTPRPGQGLVIAGGTMFGVGAALAIGAGVASHRMGTTRQEIIDLGERAGDDTTTLQARRDAELRDEYETLEDRRLALAVGSGATIVVAMILTGVGGKRMARAASHSAIIPAPGGLVFRLRF